MGKGRTVFSLLFDQLWPDLGAGVKPKFWEWRVRHCIDLGGGKLVDGGLSPCERVWREDCEAIYRGEFWFHLCYFAGVSIIAVLVDFSLRKRDCMALLNFIFLLATLSLGYYYKRREEEEFLFC